MKKQYLGDIRDLFKFDLLTDVANACKICTIHYIPLLTEEDSNKDGKFRNYKKHDGCRNADLIEYLKSYENVLPKNRDLKFIKDYFSKRKIEFTIVNENKYFKNKSRKSYFDEVETSFSGSSILFLDPDNGMEVKHNKDKHVKYSEIETLYEKMNKKSILSVIQFRRVFSNDKYWRSDLDGRLKKLKELVEQAFVIHNNRIAFFFITHSSQVCNYLNQALSAYSKKYDNLNVF